MSVIGHKHVFELGPSVFILYTTQGTLLIKFNVFKFMLFIKNLERENGNLILFYKWQKEGEVESRFNLRFVSFLKRFLDWIIVGFYFLFIQKFSFYDSSLFYYITGPGLANIEHGEIDYYLITANYYI